MTAETYIPITPATEIPFPCWLWDNKDKFWFKASECWQGCTERHNITHYCTSAAKPTGRPNPYDGAPISARELEEEASQPTVPTASGATGEALTKEQAVIIHAAHLWLDFCALHNACIRLISSACPIGKSGNQVAVLTDLLNELKTLAEKKPISPLDLSATASRPAAAQEGVRDTERLDWLEANSAGLNDAYSPPGPHVWVNLLGEHKHFYRKSYRAAIDAAMSSQPEGRG